jgi:1-acyl-sn-glycerol-3-phosphate acyltransferase
MEERTVKLLKALADVMATYHGHEAIGLENIPTQGPAIVAVNHSYITYDMLLLAAAIHEKKNRILHSAADKWFFKSHTLKPIFESINMFEGTHEGAKRTLSDGHLLLVAPGGMYESMQNKPGEIFWSKRKGFVKLAIEMQVPIVLAACPKADEVYTNYTPKVLSDFFYDNFKLPFAILRGVGLSPIPKPIKLTHLLSNPLHPPKKLEDLDDFHKKVISKMEELMKKAKDFE